MIYKKNKSTYDAVKMHMMNSTIDWFASVKMSYAEESLSIL